MIPYQILRFRINYWYAGPDTDIKIKVVNTDGVPSGCDTITITMIPYQLLLYPCQLLT
jgi:hypothetical protein